MFRERNWDKITEFDATLKQWQEEWKRLEDIIDSYHRCSNRIKKLERRLNQLSKLSKYNNTKKNEERRGLAFAQDQRTDNFSPQK